MVKRLRTIRYLFLHFDGVLLESIQGPIMRSVITGLGGVYDADTENHTLDRSLQDIVRYLNERFGLSSSSAEVWSLYQEVRARYIATHEICPKPGAAAFLDRMLALGLQPVSYGGAPVEYFERFAGALAPRLAAPRYLCTRDLRPGVRQLLESCGLRPAQALFVDEETAVALSARQHGVPFIGFTSPFKEGYKETELRRLGIAPLVRSLAEIDEPLIRSMDEAAAGGPAPLVRGAS